MGRNDLRQVLRRCLCEDLKFTLNPNVKKDSELQGPEGHSGHCVENGLWGGGAWASGRPLGKQYSEQEDCNAELEGETVGETLRGGQHGQIQEVVPFADKSAFGGKGSVSYKGGSWI